PDRFANPGCLIPTPSLQVQGTEASRETSEILPAMYERFTDRARKVMQLANQEAQRLNHEYIGTEHILLGLVKEGSGVAANVLKNLGLRLEDVREEVLNLLGHNMETDEGGGSPPEGGSEKQPSRGKSKTPALDSFGRDLTELARQGKLDPVIGRANEI